MGIGFTGSGDEVMENVGMGTREDVQVTEQSIELTICNGINGSVGPDARVFKNLGWTGNQILGFDSLLGNERLR